MDVERVLSALGDEVHYAVWSRMVLPIQIQRKKFRLVRDKPNPPQIQYWDRGRWKAIGPELNSWARANKLVGLWVREGAVLKLKPYNSEYHEDWSVNRVGDRWRVDGKLWYSPVYCDSFEEAVGGLIARLRMEGWSVPFPRVFPWQR